MDLDHPWWADAVVSAMGGVLVDLLERDAEIQAIEGALHDGRAGRGSVVVVEAASGLGKTALLRHTVECAGGAGMAVLSARAAELERDFAFGAVRQLFEPLVAEDGDRLMVGAASAAAGLLRPDRSAAAPSMFQLLHGLYWLLVNVVTRPTVVLVDDVQWADVPSLRFLGFLVRRMAALPVTLVVAVRTGEPVDAALLADIVADASVTMVEPKALSRDAVTALVRERLGAAADDEFCAACFTTTGGNPLYLRELLRVLAVDGVEPRGAATVAVRAAGPHAVRRHVAARLDRLSAQTRRVATVLAVLGDNTELGLVARHTGLDLPAVSAAVDALVRQGMLVGHVRPAYAHALVREAVLALLPSGARSAEHERAAQVLAEAGEPVERVASHLLRTLPRGDAHTVQTLLLAADDVRRRGAPDSAAVFLKRARDEPPPPDLRTHISRTLGNALAYRLALPEAEQYLREALALATTARDRSLAAFSLARFRNACADPVEAVDILCRASAEMAETGSDPDRLADRIESELMGFARVDLTRRDLLVERLARYRRRPSATAEIVDAQDSIEAVQAGEPAEAAVALAERALRTDRLTPDNSALWTAVHTLMVADRLDEVDASLERALHYAQARGLLLPIAVTRAYQARVALLRGDLGQAQQHIDHGLDTAPGQHFALPLLHATQMHLHIDHGQLDRAAALLATGALAHGRLPGSCFELWLLDARIRLRLEQGDAATARRDALDCGRLYRRWGAQRLLDVPWRLRAAEASAALGDTCAAHALIEEHAEVARQFGVARHQALADAAAARLGYADHPLRLAQRAVAQLDTAPAPLDLARALEQLGAYQARDGDRTGSRNSLRRAAELALGCGATAVATRLHARLAAGGGRPPRIRDSGVHALTPSERQVAALAADRFTNRQIAERLYVTEKTVEAHLSRVYRKLKVQSRIQLAGQLATADNG
jgi:DNA-binding CsgD family transcriptional regulator/tetratricopeptide (TPR) repeat protein